MVIATPFGFSVDLTFWQEFFSQPASAVLWDLFVIFGWAILTFFIFYAGNHFWLDYRSGLYTANWKFMLLAVDVPELAVQTPKAVEQIFAQLSGALEPPNFKEEYWDGKTQRFFSFEIISLEGYTQFLIWTEAKQRDLVEAAIYAQYPEAEITEVEDYVGLIPDRYPHPEYDLYGVEFKLEQSQFYPIRTYPHFKYDVTPDITFSDSMAAMLENFARIGKGENLWLQIIIVPVDNHWKEDGIKLVKEIITGLKESSEHILSKLGGVPQQLASDLLAYGWRDGREGEPAVSVKEPTPGKVSDLSPGKRTVVEAVEEKISKVGFKAKVRLLYAARKEVYNPRRCVSGLIGAINQFNMVSSNSFVAHATTSPKGVSKEMKRGAFVKAYKSRKVKMGGTPYILNIEELATIWHFPMPFVKAPLLQKTAAKRAEPPSGLPTETSEGRLKVKASAPTQAAPANLPVEEKFPVDAGPLPPDLPYA